MGEGKGKRRRRWPSSSSEPPSSRMDMSGPGHLGTGFRQPCAIDDARWLPLLAAFCVCLPGQRLSGRPDLN